MAHIKNFKLGLLPVYLVDLGAYRSTHTIWFFPGNINGGIDFFLYLWLSVGICPIFSGVYEWFLSVLRNTWGLDCIFLICGTQSYCDIVIQHSYLRAIWHTIALSHFSIWIYFSYFLWLWRMKRSLPMELLLLDYGTVSLILCNTHLVPSSCSTILCHRLFQQRTVIFYKLNLVRKFNENWKLCLYL